MDKHKNVPKFINAPISPEAVLKRHKTRVSSLQLRHEIIQANKRQNYINEYDRVHGYLINNIAHGHVSRDSLLQRQERLKEMFEESFKPHMHELYNK